MRLKLIMISLNYQCHQIQRGRDYGNLNYKLLSKLDGSTHHFPVYISFFGLVVLINQGVHDRKPNFREEAHENRDRVSMGEMRRFLQRNEGLIGL